MKTKWNRWRFKAYVEDYRPIKFPPPGPYWCSGEGDGYHILVAYFPVEKTWEDIMEYWPEGTDFDLMKSDCEITFSDRFAKPDWWKEEP